MTYESTCPRCGAMLTSGGCLSCGYPNGGLRERTAADTTLAEKSKGDAPLGYVRYELLAEAWDSISKIGRELFDARTRIEELEAEIVNHESRLATQQAATYAAEAERDEARRELEEAEEAIRTADIATAALSRRWVWLLQGRAVRMVRPALVRCALARNAKPQEPGT